eukprot:GHRR01018745.1.p1 GENE.GHRR01018745.1~~GHRR01018745.1.p1  ORF type:complete len:139 (-),score=50.44 GHRR01018745.1:521-937(-)
MIQQTVLYLQKQKTLLKSGVNHLHQLQYHNQPGPPLQVDLVAALLGRLLAADCLLLMLLGLLMRLLPCLLPLLLLLLADSSGAFAVEISSCHLLYKSLLLIWCLLGVIFTFQYTEKDLWLKNVACLYAQVVLPVTCYI